MQYRTLALAFAATAFAQTDLAGVVSVLATALPSSLISEYATNSAAVASDISSAFEAGNTPSWFQALPTAVQTYLVPVVGTANATVTTASSVSGAPTVIINPTGNSTLATTGRTPTTTRTTSATDSETTSSSSDDSASSSDSGDNSRETSTGGASVPTAIVGMGLAGAAGLVGLLAL